MTTQDFLNTLQQSPNKSLIFDYGLGRIKPGYHVTEVMNVTYESMDCGGQAHFWRETIIQLMGPNIQDKPEYMSVQKFLGIYSKVASSVPVGPDSEVRFEYGDSHMPALHYHVSNIEQGDDAVIIHFSQPGVTCKAFERKLDGVCCSPVKQVLTNVVWGDSASQSDRCC